MPQVLGEWEVLPFLLSDPPSRPTFSTAPPVSLTTVHTCLRLSPERLSRSSGFPVVTRSLCTQWGNTSPHEARWMAGPCGSLWPGTRGIPAHPPSVGTSC